MRCLLNGKLEQQTLQNFFQTKSEKRNEFHFSREKYGKRNPLKKQCLFSLFNPDFFFRMVNPKLTHPKMSHHHFWVFHIFFQSFSQNRARKARSEFFLPLKVPKMPISGCVT